MSGVWVGAGVAAAGIAGSVLGSNAQSSATKKGIKEQKRQFDLTRADHMPWIQAGTTAIGQLGQGTAAGGDFNRDFTAADFQADPGYAFRLREGQRAIESSASARGGVLSGGALKAATEYGQGFASNEFSNAYNRFNNDRTLRFNRLASISGLGQTAANQVGVLGANAATEIGDLYTQGGNATAAGYAGASNALGNGLNSLSNYFQQQRLQQGGTVSGTTGQGGGFPGGVKPYAWDEVPAGSKSGAPF